MHIEHTPRGCIAVVWPAGRLSLLVDARTAWVAWDGRLLWRVPVGVA